MEYGVNVSNKFAFLGDDEDASDPAEILARAELEREKEKTAPKSALKKPVVAEKKNVSIVPPSANKENVDVRRNGPRKDGQRGGPGFDRKDGPRGPRGPRRHDDENHHAPANRDNNDRFGENRPPRQQRAPGNYERRNNNAGGDGPRGPRAPRGDGANEGGNGGWQRSGGDRDHDRRDNDRRPRPQRNETSGGENNVSDGDNNQVQRNGPRYPPRGPRGPRGDRVSGSDRTGVRSVPKKDGFGKGNWGTDKDELAGESEPITDGELNKSSTKGQEGVEATETGNNVEGQEEVAAEEEKIRELTLEEWKAQQKSQAPTFNVRKAGEGGDQKVYKNLILVKPVVKDEHSTEEDEDANQNKREPREKPLNIEVSFSDSQRNRGGFREERGGNRDYRGGERSNNFERGDNRRSGGGYNDRGGNRGGFGGGARRNDGPGGSGTGGRRQQQSTGSFNLTAESFPALGAH